MRITSGKYGGRILQAPDGLNVRPTSDKVRQAIFNILLGMGYPEGAAVMDFFCGTGALGLEALSRGAAVCTFVDNASASIQSCRANIAILKAESQSRVVQTDALKPGSVPVEGPATLFFLDPPLSEGSDCAGSIGAGGRWVAGPRGDWRARDRKKWARRITPWFRQS